MSSNRNQHSRYRPRPPQMESHTEEARLDALIASPAAKSKPSSFPSRAESSSQRTKNATPEKSMMKSHLDEATRETKYATPTRREYRPSDGFGSSPRRPPRGPDRPSQATQQKSPLKNEIRPSDLFGARPRKPDDNFTKTWQALLSDP